MGSKMAARASLLFVILCSSFLGVFSQDCTFVPLYEQTVKETQTTALGTVVIGGAGVPSDLVLTGDCGANSQDPTCFVKGTLAGRTITFSPNGTAFINYLDDNKSGTSLPRVYYTFTCTLAGVANTVNGQAQFRITDENNRAPEFNLRTTSFELNLETWESQNPINFGEAIEVTDDDYVPMDSEVAYHVTLTSQDDIITIKSNDDGPNTYSYNFFLHPDAEPGNYTIGLNARDGVHDTEQTIHLYVAGSAQFQATALTVLLVAITTWYNSK